MYTPVKRVMYIGGGWGNAIYFANDSKTRIYGFKGRGNTFSEGSVLFDLANHKDDDKIPLYYISNVEWEDDPSDMFFADIDLIGGVENLSKGFGEYDENWYKTTLYKLINEYKKKVKNLGFFEFRKKRKIREYINTMEEMEKATKKVYQGFV